jgi:hypothetical protein
MMRWFHAGAFVLAASLSATGGQAAGNQLQVISDSITELDVSRARELLEKIKTDTPQVALERARLAIYSGDCDTAVAILSAPTLASSPQGSSLGELAKSCARATAGSLIVDDKPRGVWMRLQDEGDRALAPLIGDVAVRARAVIEQDLGVELPRPLRIDLVRDLFSLSAITGLPVTAAETTGTVAVARWGRVTMISPRATPLGYPWEDTLAHEITHLALSRATRDKAPLWLQEGIAKREETRWRERRPFDETPPHDEIAQVALLTGRSIGVDQLGPSIAMLPTPEAASTAFAEVTSFMQYWVAQNGVAALHLLLVDLKGSSGDDPNVAMRSVTGYDLGIWIRRWQKHITALPRARDPHHGRQPDKNLPDPARQVRLADLLWKRGHARSAATALGPVAQHSREAGVRFRAARAALAAGDIDQAALDLGRLSELDVLHGAWAALHGHLLAARGGSADAAERWYRWAVAVDPLSEDVACQGLPRTELPADAGRRELCLAARAIHRD